MLFFPPNWLTLKVITKFFSFQMRNSSVQATDVLKGLSKRKQIKDILPHGTIIPPEKRILVAALLFSHHQILLHFLSLSFELYILLAPSPLWLPPLSFFCISQSFPPGFIPSHIKLSKNNTKILNGLVFTYIISLTSFPEWLFLLHSCWEVCTICTQWRGYQDASDCSQMLLSTSSCLGWKS